MFSNIACLPIHHKAPLFLISWHVVGVLGVSMYSDWYFEQLTVWTGRFSGKNKKICHLEQKFTIRESAISRLTAVHLVTWLATFLFPVAETHNCLQKCHLFEKSLNIPCKSMRTNLFPRHEAPIFTTTNFSGIRWHVNLHKQKPWRNSWLYKFSPRGAQTHIHDF